MRNVLLSAALALCLRARRHHGRERTERSRSRSLWAAAGRRGRVSVRAFWARSSRRAFGQTVIVENRPGASTRLSHAGAQGVGAERSDPGWWRRTRSSCSILMCSGRSDPRSAQGPDADFQAAVLELRLAFRRRPRRRPLRSLSRWRRPIPSTRSSRRRRLEAASIFWGCNSAA